MKKTIAILLCAAMLLALAAACGKTAQKTDQELADAATIAAESYGYMNAILKSLGRTQHVVKGRI